MKEILAKLGITLILGALIFCGVYFFEKSFEDDKEQAKSALEDIVRYSMEYAYFQGQKDALEGDIRIEQVNDTTWVWTKSPVDSRTLDQVTYKPESDKK